ncbi:MAG: DUF2628 domain-containing protein [Clostridia bacterium]|nr:DUF2628 domain-containing protein [Clostridia bacterium]
MTDNFDTPVIDGISNSALREYIDKNHDYYFKKFEKHKGKPHFFSLNFAALFFGETWFFYRKMYKTATFFTLIYILLTSVMIVACSYMFKAEVNEYKNAKLAYDTYMLDSEGFVSDDYEYASAELTSLTENLDSATKQISKVVFIAGLPALVFTFVVRLLANSIYKNHIIKNINFSKGGVSFPVGIISAVATTAVNTTIQDLLSLIPIIAQYLDVTNHL